MKQYLNGEYLDISEAEQKVIIAQSKIEKAHKDNQKAEKKSKETNKASAIGKLKVLGLSDDEITALTGD